MTAPVLIMTGATSGIGRDSAPVFAAAGYRLVLAGRRAKLGEELVAELERAGYTAAFKQTDVADNEQLAELFAFAQTTYGRVDVVFNNAGVDGEWVPLADKVSHSCTCMPSLQYSSSF